MGLFLDIGTDAATDAAKLTVVMGATSSFDFRTVSDDIDNDIDLVLKGDASNETIGGTLHGDDIIGDAGTDRLSGWEGDDSLFGGNDNDVLAGGLGTDTADYSAATAGVTLSLANSGPGAGEAAGDTFNSVENVIGSQYGDTVTGSNAVNSLSGNGGNDKLDGGGGNDVLELPLFDRTVSY